FADLRQCGNFGDDPLAQQQADLVNHHQLAGIGNGYGQTPVARLFERHEVVAEHQPWRNLRKQLVMQLKMVQVENLASVPSWAVLRAVQFRGMGSGPGLAVASAPKHRFLFYLFRHASHAKPASPISLAPDDETPTPRARNAPPQTKARDIQR